jgi:hypothetical protein
VSYVEVKEGFYRYEVGIFSTPCELREHLGDDPEENGRGAEKHAVKGNRAETEMLLFRDLARKANIT